VTIDSHWPDSFNSLVCRGRRDTYLLGDRPLRQNGSCDSYHSRSYLLLHQLGIWRRYYFKFNLLHRYPCRQHSRGTSNHCDSLHGTNCEEDGGQEGACEKPLVGGDTRLHFLHLLRQDWYSDPKQDDRFSPVLWKLACRCRNKL
jgi:hypothetical protein